MQPVFLETIQRVRFWRNIRWNVVVATGCFDVLHVGHLKLFEFAKAQGDFLLVGINSDASVRALKGESRPINTEQDRAEMVLGLRCVDAVAVFDDVRATSFLTETRPNVWVKGGDYTLETLDQNERHAVESQGGKIVFFRSISGRSTTSILARIG